jgi:uncharacterized YceG family protein
VSRSSEEREAARREREIARLRRAGKPIPPELLNPVASTPPEPIAPPPEPVAPPPEPVAPPPEPVAPPEPHVPPAEPYVPPAEPEPVPPPAAAASEPEPADQHTGDWHTDEDTGDWGYETGDHPATDAPTAAIVGGTFAGAPDGPRARRRHRPHAPRKRGSKIALLVVGAVIVLGVLWFANSLFQPFAGQGTGRVAVVIPPGTSTSGIGDILAKQGVVDSAFFFGLRARMDGAKLRSGKHVLQHDMSYGDAIAALSKAPKSVRLVTVSIPEGLSRREIAPRTKAAGLKGNYVTATKTSRLLTPSKYGAPKGTNTLEGFLFPATYQFKPGAPVKQLVNLQLKAFKKNIAGVDLRYAKKKNLTIYDILIIASMIDRETAIQSERPKVAAVIYNRLKAKMILGIDATTRYQYDNWDKPITQSQLRSPSPYNTRIHQGLPPTPIGNPGLAAIKAAANPSRAGYLYYVVKPCGNGAQAFSTTDAQFQQDVAAYNAARAKNGGNDPSHCKK